jgi:hypothetical protein
MHSFSKRHGFGRAKEIIIREDAPENLRYFVIETARSLGLDVDLQSRILSQVLHLRPVGNVKEWRVWDEVQEWMSTCPWFKVYDIIEAFYDRIELTISVNHAYTFADNINEFFIDEGIGWKILITEDGGQIVTRGTEAFEAMVAAAVPALEASERPTAAKHLHEALQDLSRRPQADLPGAAYHAMGSLECVARDVTGHLNATFGEILKHCPGLLPRPLDTALSQVWGYASNVARHVQEGREIDRDEAELLVGLSATISTYLLRKFTP